MQARKMGTPGVIFAIYYLWLPPFGVSYSFFSGTGRVLLGSSNVAVEMECCAVRQEMVDKNIKRYNKCEQAMTVSTCICSHAPRRQHFCLHKFGILLVLQTRASFLFVCFAHFSQVPCLTLTARAASSSSVQSV